MFWKKIYLFQTNIYLAQRGFVWIKQMSFNLNKSFVWMKKSLSNNLFSIMQSNSFPEWLLSFQMKNLILIKTNARQRNFDHLIFFVSHNIFPTKKGYLVLWMSSRYIKDLYQKHQRNVFRTSSYFVCTWKDWTIINFSEETEKSAYVRWVHFNFVPAFSLREKHYSIYSIEFLIC